MPDPLDSPVVFAYDGSDEARAAVEEGARLFAGRAAFVVSAWQSATGIASAGTLALPADVAGVAYERLDEATRTQAGELAREGAELARSHGLDAGPLALEAPGPIWAAIADFAEERRAAAIVVGSRGRSGVASVLLGSVSSGLVHHSRRPVLVVRSQD